MATCHFCSGVALTALSVSALLAGCSCKEDPQDTGEVEVVEERDRGQWLSMGALSNGTPVAAFYDREKDGLGVALGTISEGSDGETSATWTYEEADGFADESGMDVGDRGSYASMLVGAGDTIWIAYRDNSNKALRYARRSWQLEEGAMPPGITGSWTSDVADVGGGSSPDSGYWASMAMTPDGDPVIANYDKGQGELRVVRWDGSSFGSAIIIEGEAYTAQDSGEEAKDADVGSYARLHIDAQGTEYVAYYDAAWGALRLALGGADGFTVHTVDEDGDVGQWPSLLTDDQGELHIAYHDVGNQDLKHAYGSPGAMVVEVVDAGEYVGADTEIFLNGSQLSILYFDGQENDVKLASKAGETWTTATLAGSDGIALGYHNEVISSNGSYYAGCYDYTNRVIWFGAIQ